MFFAEKIDWNMTQLIPLCLIGLTTRDFSKSPWFNNQGLLQKSQARSTTRDFSKSPKFINQGLEFDNKTNIDCSFSYRFVVLQLNFQQIEIATFANNCFLKYTLKTRRNAYS